MRTLAGTLGMVVGTSVVPGLAVRYNLTVANEHTYVVGDGLWVVHNNTCSQYKQDVRDINDDSHIGEHDVHRDLAPTSPDAIRDGPGPRTYIEVKETSADVGYDEFFKINKGGRTLRQLGNYQRSVWPFEYLFKYAPYQEAADAIKTAGGSVIQWSGPGSIISML